MKRRRGNMPVKVKTIVRIMDVWERGEGCKGVMEKRKEMHENLLKIRENDLMMDEVKLEAL